MTFVTSELHDIMRVLMLINFRDKCECDQEELRVRVQQFLKCQSCVEKEDFDYSLKALVSEGLVVINGNKIELTERGTLLCTELKKTLFKKEPILEIVVGITDGSITGLVVILSALLSGLAKQTTIFAAALTLTAVSLTGFSSIFLGGKTEDIADLISLKTLMENGFYDISDNRVRDKSLSLIKNLFSVLHNEINRASITAASISAATALASGLVPILLFLELPEPIGAVISLAFVAVIVLLFLVRYRYRKTQTHWQIILLETLGIIAVSVVISLLLGTLKG